MLAVVDTTTKFQFTHPGRGATSIVVRITRLRTRFNSRTPGGVRLVLPLVLVLTVLFQFTHPGRGATLYYLATPLVMQFQFTHPGRGATA